MKYLRMMVDTHVKNKETDKLSGVWQFFKSYDTYLLRKPFKTKANTTFNSVIKYFRWDFTGTLRKQILQKIKSIKRYFHPLNLFWQDLSTLYFLRE